MKVLFLYISPISILLLCSYAANTQTQWIDSVKKVLPTQKEDTNKVNTLNALSANFFYIGDNKNAFEKALL